MSNWHVAAAAERAAQECCDDRLARAGRVLSEAFRAALAASWARPAGGGACRAYTEVMLPASRAYAAERADAKRQLDNGIMAARQ